MKDWVGLLARLVLGGSLFIAGLTKIGNLELSVQSVRAYQLLPYDLAKWVGYALPPFEIILGLMIMAGFLTRWTSLLGSLLMVAFIIGIASAWARGLTIDCGCFGSGGIVEPEETQYPQDIARDLLFLAAGVWLVVRPRSAFAVDQVLFGGPADLDSDDLDDDDLDADDPVVPTATATTKEQ
ncbi:DoxX family protein [Aestuariimicrobium sp. Y1814]|uniref:DoxX family protein n=1 Tax=Aestuariimicrobium sp. Y1814 TaxID=3418742 RepID=UPI003DA6D147